MKRILKQLTIRSRANRRGMTYNERFYIPSLMQPRDHVRLIRYLRLSKGKPAFDRPECLKKYPDVAANNLETEMLTRGYSDPSKCAYYLLAQLSWALQPLTKESH